MKHFALAAALLAASPALAGAPGTVTSAAGQPVPAWTVQASPNIVTQRGLFDDAVGDALPVAWVTINEPGYWGLKRAQIRDFRTPNDQFDAFSSRNRGEFTNTGGSTDFTVRQKLDAPTYKSQRIVAIDWADRKLGEGNRIDVRGRQPNGQWISLGTVEPGGRLPNGSVLSIQVEHRGQQIGMIEYRFTGPNPRDIVALEQCGCLKGKPTASVKVAKGKTVSAKAGKAKAASAGKAAKGKAGKAGKASKAARAR